MDNTQNELNMEEKTSFTLSSLSLFPPDINNVNKNIIYYSKYDIENIECTISIGMTLGIKIQYIIDKIQSLQQKDGTYRIDSNCYKLGDKVMITKGPFFGLTAIFKELPVN